MRFNGRAEWQGKPVKAADLLPGDQATVEHEPADQGRQATAISVSRSVPLEGYLRKIGPLAGDATKKEIAVAQGPGDSAALEVWPLADSCEITLNGQRTVGDELVKLADLKPGDEVTVQHDTLVRKIEALRTFHQSGVIESVQAHRGRFELLPQGADRPTAHSVTPDCKIRLGDEPVQLADLHRGDEATISFDSPDNPNADVLSIEALRRPDPQRWALLVGAQSYDDKSLTLLPYAVTDARYVAQALVRRYQVPQDHVLVLADESKLHWEQMVPAFIDKLPPDAQLLVYYDGHAVADTAGKIYLTPKDFQLARPEATGVSLAWFVGELERLPLRYKLLLLDATHVNPGANPPPEPSSAEMIQSLQEPGMPAPLRTITAITSCQAGERGHDARDKNHGRFALLLAEGFSGAANANEDSHIEPVELYEFLVKQLSTGPTPQTPQLFLPNNTPPRLTEDAKKAIRRLASNLLTPHIDPKKVDDEYAAAQELSQAEAEPKLIFGLLLIKAKKDAEAIKVFDMIKGDHPDLFLPLMGATWSRFRKQDIGGGSVDLLHLLNKLEKASQAGSDAEQKYIVAVSAWAGRMREFAAAAAPEQRRPPQTLLDEIDASAKQLSEPARRAFDQGRAHVHKVTTGLDKQIADTADQSEQLKLQVKRRQLPEYAAFPFEAATQNVFDGMQK